MFESLILGAVQGIAEWLPVSSEAMIVLVKTNFFPNGMSFSELISYAIFLHLGTLLAVTVYYWKHVKKLIIEIFSYTQLNSEKKNYINFLAIVTITSGILGMILLKIVEHYENFFVNDVVINIFVAVFLIITAVLLYSTENKKEQKEVSLTGKRALITGFFQGLAAIPGISRSGSTVAGMGLLGIKKEQALELSFILSIPIVLLANIILNSREFLNFTTEHFVALISAFVFGLLTIEILLRIVRKIRFSYFVGGFAVLLLIINFVIL
ncbi:MAG: undecaprenyl-diphosphate phosphatase [Candidatus Pacebacteria bacterium]|nr:undecaprenyl-diphosphate phosphatase [Candidatus Paceibacterota bacterium]